jgi:hypothetical protein
VKAYLQHLRSQGSGALKPTASSVVAPGVR